MTWDELRSEAFGEMNMNPTEFYEMDHEDFWLKHRGFFDARLYDRQSLRWAVAPIVQVLATKTVDIMKWMPLPGDDVLRTAIHKHDKISTEAARQRALVNYERVKAAKGTGKKSGVTLAEKLEMMRIFKEQGTA